MKRFSVSLLFTTIACFTCALSSIAQTAGKTFITKHIAAYGKPYQHVPDRRDVNIYQVNIRAFSKAGNFKGVIARLDSIKALGINVIYLMPTYPVGVLKSTNSNYCISNYKAVNKDFGTLADLRVLAAGAHKRYMAVMMDWVANHTSFDNVWTVNKSWYLQDEKGNIISPPGMGWNDVAQLNFKNAAMRLAMINAMKYWVLTANIDGFRCDYADGPPVDFWKQAFDTLRNIKSHKLLLLAEGSHNDLYSAGFDFNFGFNFFGDLKDIFKNYRSVLSIDTANINDYKGTSNGQQIVRYITNHDVNSSDGTPLELFGGKKGSMAAFIVVAYMKSVPMIYNGQEKATPYRIVFPFKSQTVDWSLNPDVTAEYKKVIALRNRSNAIRRGQLTSYSTVDICAFTKEAGNEKIFVLDNLRDKTVTYHIPANLTTTLWKDAFTGAPAKTGADVTLQPYSYMVLKN